MAWLWKQGRPTLLAVVGMGILGYKAFHRGRGHGAPATDDASRPPDTAL